jgi:hypothetical protein
MEKDDCEDCYALTVLGPLPAIQDYQEVKRLVAVRVGEGSQLAPVAL